MPPALRRSPVGAGSASKAVIYPGRKPSLPSAGVSAFMEDPGRSAIDASIFWRADVDEAVVTVDALQCLADDRDALSPLEMGTAVLILRQEQGREELLLRCARGSVRLSVRSGSCLSGPVRFRYALEGLRSLPPKLLTLKRLLGLVRGDPPSRGLYPREARAGRWVMMLRALDGFEAGASHREIAAALFGEDRARNEWREGSDYLRLRVQRLFRTATALSAGHYRALLRAP